MAARAANNPYHFQTANVSCSRSYWRTAYWASRIRRRSFLWRIIGESILLIVSFWRQQLSHYILAFEAARLTAIFGIRAVYSLIKQYVRFPLRLLLAYRRILD